MNYVFKLFFITPGLAVLCEQCWGPKGCRAVRGDGRTIAKEESVTRYMSLTPGPRYMAPESFPAASPGDV